jgi:hypothetical protein
MLTHRGCSITAFGALLLLIGTGLAHAQAPPDATIPRVRNPPLDSDLLNLPGDLRAVDTPLPPNLSEFIKDPAMTLALGKALFWDMQVGSDGIQACASCHFRAGADPRSKNQIHRGVPSLFPGTNVQLEELDFPLSKLAERACAARSIPIPTAATLCRRKAFIISGTKSTQTDSPSAV